jgi:hypothetical protein
MSFLESHRIHAVAQTAGFRAIGEYVTKMSVASVAKRFNSLQKARAVEAVGDYVHFDRLGE